MKGEFNKKLIVWLSICSTIVTISLTIYNAILNTKIQDTEIQLKKMETELKIKSQELESQKEKTSRYEFINKLLPDVLNKDKAHVILTTNLITLVLDEKEAQKLFDGFSISNNKDIQEVGKIGSENIQNQRERLKSALNHEAAGFEFLINGEYNKAISEFLTTDNIYPTFHQVYEIASLLRQNINKMNDINTRKTVLKQIVNELNYGAPSIYLNRLEELSK
jgi:hypothetical protein